MLLTVSVNYTCQLMFKENVFMLIKSRLKIAEGKLWILNYTLDVLEKYKHITLIESNTSRICSLEPEKLGLNG
jgi:hypothetical protein